MRDFKHMVRCLCCDSEFQFGPHTYHGKHIAGYNMTVCNSCYSGNWDEWAPHYEGKIVTHLRSLGVAPPARNASGWLPRDWPGESHGA